MKPKEYLVSIGELKEIKRGRLSLAHIELCKKAAANGIRIEGYSIATAATDETPAVVTKSKISTEKVIADLPAEIYPENEFTAYEFVDGKKIPRGMREVCRHSGVSLIYCPCNGHKIVARDSNLNGALVYIERK